MKKTTLFAIIFFGACLSCIQVAKAQDDAQIRKMLVGVWWFYELESAFTTKENISEEEKALLESEKKEMREEFSFNFRKDGKYEIKMILVGQETKDVGIWKVKGEYLVITSKEGKETTLSIEEISKTKLILKDGNTSLVLVK